MSRNYCDNSVELICFLSPTSALLLVENFCARHEACLCNRKVSVLQFCISNVCHFKVLTAAAKKKKLIILLSVS